MNNNEFVERVSGYIDNNGDNFDIYRADIVDKNGTATIQSWGYNFPIPTELDLENVNLIQIRKKLRNRRRK